jgi:hypothetical protein
MNRSYEHDGAAALAKVRHGKAGQHHRPDDIGVEHGEHFPRIELGDRSAHHVAGVVDERIDAAAVLHCGVDQAPPVSVVRDVADNRSAVGSDFRLHCVDFFAPAAADRDPRSLSREVQCGAAAEARATAGDEDRESREVLHG